MVNHYPGDLDRIFHAMADPTRRAVLEELTRGGRSVGVLAEPFDMSFPAITKHVKVLERAGLVKKIRKGKFVECHLQEGALQMASSWIHQQQRYWKAQLDGLEKFLEAEKEESGPENQ